MQVEFHPAAETDVEEAQRWYVERSAIAARVVSETFSLHEHSERGREIRSDDDHVRPGVE